MTNKTLGTRWAKYPFSRCRLLHEFATLAEHVRILLLDMSPMLCSFRYKLARLAIHYDLGANSSGDDDENLNKTCGADVSTSDSMRRPSQIWRQAVETVACVCLRRPLLLSRVSLWFSGFSDRLAEYYWNRTVWDLEFDETVPRCISRIYK